MAGLLAGGEPRLGRGPALPVGVVGVPSASAALVAAPAAGLPPHPRPPGKGEEGGDRRGSTARPGRRRLLSRHRPSLPLGSRQPLPQLSLLRGQPRLTPGGCPIRLARHAQRPPPPRFAALSSETPDSRRAHNNRDRTGDRGGQLGATQCAEGPLLSLRRSFLSSASRLMASHTPRAKGNLRERQRGGGWPPSAATPTSLGVAILRHEVPP